MLESSDRLGSSKESECPSRRFMRLRPRPPVGEEGEQIERADGAIAVEVGGAAFARAHRLFGWKAVRTCRIGEMKRCQGQDYFLGRKGSKNSS